MILNRHEHRREHKGQGAGMGRSWESSRITEASGRTDLTFCAPSFQPPDALRKDLPDIRLHSPQYSTVSSHPPLLLPAASQLHQMTSLKEKTLSLLTPSPLCTSTTTPFDWGLLQRRLCHLLGNQTLPVPSAALHHITPT